MSGWLASIDGWLRTHERQLIELRRQIHAHPELGIDVPHTTDLIERRLLEAGLSPQRFRGGNGLAVDIGQGPRIVGLRADIDALPLQELTNLPFASRIDGRSHACGHDMHAAFAMGAALALAQAPELPGRVRVIFQPAEETLGGAHMVIANGILDGLERVFALHCEPQVKVGQAGTRLGAITAACDLVEIHLSGPGGHTARPHLSVDLVDALARIVTTVPGLTSRSVDPRDGLSVVFGAIEAGSAPNAIPSEGVLRGTVRTLTRAGWTAAEDAVRRLVDEVAALTRASVKIDYRRGVPPVDNDVTSFSLLRTAMAGVVGDDSVYMPEQSMGGEDFGWYADYAPVGMGRIGVYPGSGPMSDLHQGTFVADERAILIGARVLAHTAIGSLTSPTSLPTG
ncbi:amidohydrolase [Antricoccus suffuscus]|uniref:Amidohydrolase n=1 Tax=Antricoccus suffuscus TaxID=1629062 RepID=A0A2T0ZC09_9ACTN|nr:amidohydrolase [Antricoccus suffuscus]PRZ33876.1 amidohydrolase [Antricoccus suffuscus]